MKSWWLAVCVGCALGIRASADPASVVLDFRFGAATGLQGWQPNGHLRDVRTLEDGLHCRGAGSDPILELQTRLDLPARAWQVVEIRLRADRDGVAELFWGPTDEGPYGDFSQARSLRFPVRGGTAFQTHRLRPFWHPDQRLTRLRLDLFDGAAFVLASVRILDGPDAEASRVPEFDFATGGEPAWTSNEDLDATTSESGLRLGMRSGQGRAFAPPVDFDAATRPIVSIRMATDRGRRGTVFFATADEPGLHAFSFPLESDGREHTYTLDLMASAAWKGRVIALGLQPSDEAGAVAGVRWVKVVASPVGSPELSVPFAGAEEALPRAGRPLRWVARLRNSGGGTASNVTATLAVPRGLRIRSGSGRRVQPRLGFGQEVEWSWELEGARPGNPVLGLEVSAEGLPPFRHEAVLGLGPRGGGLQDPGRLPAPRPVRGPYEVGVYYFPGWRTAGPWEPIRRFPERRPVLGWYREGDPEVADWHIRWAVEHGITFFAYDWYWNRGARQLEHALHEGYFRAQHRGLLKFCLLWANHNPPGSSSLVDCLEVTRFWIANYFHRPEHLRIDGKPAVIVFSPDRLTADLGSDGVRRALGAMRAECAAAGLGGLVVLACVPDAGGARQCAAEGYDAVTAYTWPHLGVPEGRFHAPFESLLDGYRHQWTHLAETAGIPLLTPVCGGWDSRPWHGENHWVRFGRTPSLFRRHLEDARAFLDRHAPGAGANPGSGAAAPGAPGVPESQGATPGTRVLPMVLVEAWNEFGEGAYIEPHQEHGFGYLDAIRDVFGGAEGRRRHRDVAPADVGAGPYDVPRLEVGRSAWRFDRDDQGWDQCMDLTGVVVRDGALAAIISGNDPALFSPPLLADPGMFTQVTLRLRLSPLDGPGFQDSAQLFWRTATLPESEAASVRFPVRVDGQWHEYAVSVAGHARWRGTVVRLRLDPVNRPGVRLELESIALAP